MMNSGTVLGSVYSRSWGSSLLVGSLKSTMEPLSWTWTRSIIRMLVVMTEINLPLILSHVSWGSTSWLVRALNNLWLFKILGQLDGVLICLSLRLWYNLRIIHIRGLRKILVINLSLVLGNKVFDLFWDHTSNWQRLSSWLVHTTCSCMRLLAWLIQRWAINPMMVVWPSILFATKLSMRLVMVFWSYHICRCLSFSRDIISLRIHNDWHSRLIIVIIMSSSVLLIGLMILLVMVVQVTVPMRMGRICRWPSPIGIPWIAGETLTVLLIVSVRCMVGRRVDKRVLLCSVVAVIADVVSSGRTEWFVGHGRDVDWRSCTWLAVWGNRCFLFLICIYKYILV